KIPPRTLLNIFEWHNFQLGQKRLQLQANFPQEAEDFKNALFDGIRAGWLPSYVTSPAKLDRLNRVTVIADDGSGTTIKTIYASVHRRDEGGYIYTKAPGYESDRQAAIHEL